MTKIYKFKHKIIGQGVHSNKLPQFHKHVVPHEQTTSNDIIGNVTNGGMQFNNTSNVGSISGGAILDLHSNRFVNKNVVNPRTRNINKDTLVRMKF